MKRSIKVVVGAQYGSEAKGEFVGHLAKELGGGVAVRTGSINAGHTVYYKGLPYKMQQLPTAWVEPDFKLIIGAGAYISPEILDREVEMIERVMPGVRNRLFIDHCAGLHLPRHHEEEKGLHERMGSTGEGCMAAIVDKMKRGFEYKRFSESEYAVKYEACLADTTELLRSAYNGGEYIILEGTQGTMLDLHFGLYPYVTSRQTIAANWVTEAGLPPSYEYEVALVARTYPIRVAGNSGPLPYETSWEELTSQVNVKLQ